MSEARPAFVAQAFHPSFGEEAIEGRIVISQWHLRFESQTVVMEIPLARLQIELDESASGRICFSDPERADWLLCTWDGKILEHRFLTQQANTRNQIRAMRGRGELSRRLKVCLAFLGAFVLIAIVASVGMGLIARLLVARVPVEWEQELGDSLLVDFKTKEKVLESPQLMARLTNAVAPLLSALPKTGLQYRFYLVEEDLPNAFALPGGHVVMTTGLMNLADRPEELAAVAAHEIAHVTHRHLFRKIVSSAGPMILFQVFAGRGGLLSTLGAGSQLLVAQSFSQEYELEADATGWNYLVAARIDPRALPDMLRKLDAFQANFAQDLEVHAFSTHPATEKRVRRLDAKWKSLKNKTGFINFDNLEPR